MHTNKCQSSSAVWLLVPRTMSMWWLWWWKWGHWCGNGDTCLVENLSSTQMLSLSSGSWEIQESDELQHSLHLSQQCWRHGPGRARLLVAAATQLEIKQEPKMKKENELLTCLHTDPHIVLTNVIIICSQQQSHNCRWVLFQIRFQQCQSFEVAFQYATFIVVKYYF